MIRLFEGGGARGFELLHPAKTEPEWSRLRSAAARLLRARGGTLAAKLLEQVPWELWQGTNYFGDEFNVLYGRMPLERYASLAEKAARSDVRDAAAAVAETVSEVDRYVRFIAVALDTETGPEPVPPPSLTVSSASVDRALRDAEALLTSTGPSSAVDRVHTALHGYLRAACARAGIGVDPSASLTSLFKALRQAHSAFLDQGPRGSDIGRIGNALANILDAMNPLRNVASNAHPNEDVLKGPEAMLVINAARTILHYLDAKLG